MTDKIPVSIDPDLEDLIPGFLQNRANDVAAIRQLIGQADYAKIRLLGHSMKGAGGGYGFDRITDIGRDIEDAAVDKDDPTISRAVDDLEDYLVRVEVVFEQ